MYDCEWVVPSTENYWFGVTTLFLYMHEPMCNRTKGSNREHEFHDGIILLHIGIIILMYGVGPIVNNYS